MNLGDLYKWCTACVPEADEGVIPSVSTTLLDKRSILNEGASEFVKLTRCLPKEANINVTAGNPTYSLISNVPDFLEMREEGVWHYRTVSNTSTWERLAPTTVRELDQRFSNWRTQSASDTIRYYWEDGDTIGLFYTPSTAVTGGLKVYYYAMPSDMSSATDYPFTGNVRSTRLGNYEKALLVYYEYRALGILGYKDDATNKQREFYLLADKAKADLQARVDLAQEASLKPRTYLRYYRGAFNR